MLNKNDTPISNRTIPAYEKGCLIVTLILPMSILEEVTYYSSVFAVEQSCTSSGGEMEPMEVKVEREEIATAPLAASGVPVALEETGELDQVAVMADRAVLAVIVGQED